MTIEELIAALETANLLSRKLDAAIYRLVGLRSDEEAHCRDWCRMDGRTDLTRDRYILSHAPRYTESIDSAMTLVQASASVTMERYIKGWYVVIAQPSDAPVAYRGDRKPLPIAICIAALKARAALKQEPGG